MFQRILVPLDGSKQAERAIPVAASLARVSGGSIVFVRVVLPPMEYGKYAAPHLQAWERRFYENSRSQAASYLASMLLTHAYELAGIDTDIGVATGLVTPALLSVAQREQADLIVMYSENEGTLKRWMFGSVAHDAVHQSQVPVLVLHDGGKISFSPGPAHSLHLLVPLDGTRQSEAALEPSLRLLEAVPVSERTTLHLVRVVDLPPVEGNWRSQNHVDSLMQEKAAREAEAYLKDMIERLHSRGGKSSRLAMSATVAIGEDVAKAINMVAQSIERTERMGAHVLMVMALHEHKKLWRLFMGSVTEHVLHSTHFPLLVIHPQETGAIIEKRQG